MMDVEAYASGYAPCAGKWMRLIHIAKVTAREHPETTKAALEICLNEISSSTNPSIAQLAARYYRDLTGNSTSVDFDEISTRYEAKLTALIGDQQLYQNSQIRESIRMGYMDMGEFLFESGKTEQAVNAYTAACQHCSTAPQYSEATLCLLQCVLHMNQVEKLAALVAKLRSLPLLNEDELVHDNLRATCGLALLVGGDLEEASKLLGHISTHFLNAPMSWINVNNVTLYAVVSFLGSRARADINEQLLTRSTFHGYLETEPHLRSLLRNLIKCNYAAVVSGLAALEHMILLDKFLFGVKDTLVHKIKSNLLSIYTEPFYTLPLERLASDLGLGSPEHCQAWIELAKGLAQDGQLRFRYQPDTNTLLTSDDVILNTIWERTRSMYNKCIQQGVHDESLKTLATQLNLE